MKIQWQSEPITKNLDGRFFLSTDNERGQVVGHKRGPGSATFVLSYDHSPTLEYADAESMVGFRIFDDKRSRDKAQALNSRTCPAPELELAAAQ